MAYMTRNATQPGASNFSTPSGPNQFYEQRYTTAGPQEWIYAPDVGPWYVTIYFPNGPGAAFIEGSDEPPSDVGNTQTNSYVTSLPVYSAQHVYPITDHVVDITRVKIEGATAIRVNVLGGTVDVTVRC